MQSYMLWSDPVQRRNAIPSSVFAFDQNLVVSGMSSDADGFQLRGSGYQNDRTDTSWTDHKSGVEAEQEAVLGNRIEMETMETRDVVFPCSSLLQFADGVTRDIRKLFRGVAYIYDGAWSGQCQDQGNLQGQGKGQFKGHFQCQGQVQLQGHIHFQRHLQSQEVSQGQLLWPSQGEELRQGQCQNQEENQGRFHADLQHQSGGHCHGQGQVHCGRPPEEKIGQHPGKSSIGKYSCGECRNLGPMEELFKVVEEGDRDFWNLRGSSSEPPLSLPGIPMSLRQLPASFWHQPSAIPVPIGLLPAPFWHPTVTSPDHCQTLHLV